MIGRRWVEPRRERHVLRAASGGLLLRAAKSGDELDYRAIAGATLRGTRPPRLPKLRHGAAAK